jgi:hypothetical protein
MKFNWLFCRNAVGTKSKYTEYKHSVYHNIFYSNVGRKKRVGARDAQNPGKQLANVALILEVELIITFGFTPQITGKLIKA